MDPKVFAAAIAAVVEANPMHADHVQSDDKVAITPDGQRAIVSCSCGVVLAVGLPKLSEPKAESKSIIKNVKVNDA